MLSCISFDSYIKPQLYAVRLWELNVVYLLIPTSNHNYCLAKLCHFLLYIFWFLHQTTTFSVQMSKVTPLYIFWFLHQTTTCSLHRSVWICCISFDSYIKPQLRHVRCENVPVVYLLIPTSNHNGNHLEKTNILVVYLLIPTSNHNFFLALVITSVVVYLLIPTSNHNYGIYSAV